VYRIRELKNGQGSKACRTIEKEKEEKCSLATESAAK
jgi:hypothetical protein